MFKELFKFPIVMVDGNKEEEKEKAQQRLALDTSSPEVDMIIGEAECPYDDFLSIADRWLPDDRSFQEALEGNFNACYVLFANCGTYVVPWTKEKFKKELMKFIKNYESNEK